MQPTQPSCCCTHTLLPTQKIFFPHKIPIPLCAHGGPFRRRVCAAIGRNGAHGRPVGRWRPCVYCSCASGMRGALQWRCSGCAAGWRDCAPPAPQCAQGDRAGALTFCWLLRRQWCSFFMGQVSPLPLLGARGPARPLTRPCTIVRRNDAGQLVPPEAGSDAAAPAMVRALGCMPQHTCHSCLCWQISLPHRLSLPERATIVSLGSGHACAVVASGRVFTWGSATFMGNTARPTPVPLPSSAGAALFVACGRSHALCVCAAGRLVAWGDNSHGQLGVTLSGTAMPPVVARVGDSSDLRVVTAAAGDTHSLVVTECVHAASPAPRVCTSRGLGPSSSRALHVPVTAVCMPLALAPMGNWASEMPLRPAAHSASLCLRASPSRRWHAGRGTRRHVLVRRHARVLQLLRRQPRLSVVVRAQ